MTPPTPTPPATLRVAVELVYVRSCQECVTLAEQTAVAGIRDKQVTALRLIPGSKHACGAVEAPKQALPPSGASTGPLPGQEALFAPMPVSDTNGFDPEGR